jgi:sterol desaturase/sphingolipid hydroxylase (fatty acid hydroxylase superfamily)
VNGTLWLANLVVIGAVCGACACTAARWAGRAGIGALNTWPLPWWLALPIAIVALDFVSYCWHRANHGVALLWRFHQVHHSDATFTVSTAVRFHPGELLLSLPLRLAAVVLIGASAEAVVLFEIVFTVANLLEHGDIALPRRIERTIERLYITPALHRRHHTRRGPDRDTNFGTVFSIWDRALGTYARNDSAIRIETGLPGLDDLTPCRAFMLPLERPVT